MPSLLVPSVCFHRNPQLKPGLDALLVFLLERDYTSAARWAIYDHVAVNGTLAGSVYLDPADEAEAEEVFVNALPALDPASPAWDKDDVILDREMLEAGTHPLSFGDPADEDLLAPACEGEAAGLVEDVYLFERPLPPIVGGAPEPDDPSFEPSDEDARWWADQAADVVPQSPSPADWEDYFRHRDQVAGRAAAARLAEAIYGYE